DFRLLSFFAGMGTAHLQGMEGQARTPWPPVAHIAPKGMAQGREVPSALLGAPRYQLHHKLRAGGMDLLALNAGDSPPALDRKLYGARPLPLSQADGVVNPAHLALGPERAYFRLHLRLLGEEDHTGSEGIQAVHRPGGELQPPGEEIPGDLVGQAPLVFYRIGG